jgi:hypothetical protein
MVAGRGAGAAALARLPAARLVARAVANDRDRAAG